MDKFKYQKQVEQIQNHSGILSGNKQQLRRHRQMMEKDYMWTGSKAICQTILSAAVYYW